ncbi:MAG: arsenic resistance N-acetyltransferase ArsN2 [Candidatus Hodarchaeota archaeon]
MIDVNKAKNNDEKSVLLLLKEVNLPLEGVTENFDNFFVAYKDGQLVGCAGIEIYNNFGLLRSVAVHSSSQGYGLGRMLVNTVHKFSVEKGLKKIYLLTETAEKFFSKLNYVAIPRDKVDAKVKQSIEFTSLCPETAICMVKILN